MKPFRFYNASQKTNEWQRNLPHRGQDAICYFVTFMTNDAMPSAAKEKWKKHRQLWLRGHGLSPDLNRKEILEALPPEKQKSFERMLSATYHRVLDGGSGECVLAKPEVRQNVVAALQYHAGTTCQMGGFVVMPNHVHVLLQPYEDESLKKILGSVRSFSAKQVNQELGRSGSFWAREPFDHMVRSRRHFERYQQYIRANPKRANLREEMFTVSS